MQPLNKQLMKNLLALPGLPDFGRGHLLGLLGLLGLVLSLGLGLGQRLFAFLLLALATAGGRLSLVALLIFVLVLNGLLNDGLVSAGLLLVLVLLLVFLILQGLVLVLLRGHKLIPADHMDTLDGGSGLLIWLCWLWRGIVNNAIPALVASHLAALVAVHPTFLQPCNQLM